MAKDTRSDDKKSQSRGLSRRGGAVADWASANPATIMDVIIAASIVHGAVRFGVTSDGGAYSVGIYGDGEPYTEYCRPSENLDEFLLDIKQLFESIADDLATGAASQKSRK